ncbi:MAG: hypothetical protein K9G36_05495 [Crocinitomicaceae bacterium]|jgi:hypothetical protein|nr:hypothetical protein [Crocinitomicaceae bacterium]MCF8410825.1 hypothetical protein [Crocinitomicaceae bacterium]MCF8443518.1 hypothetical protein [Crocinitomicaceae bacterium]
MRKLLFFGFFLFSFSSFCQKKVGEVLKTGNTYSSDEISLAISKADWCGYLHENQRLKINFDDGAVVELFSKSELTLSNFPPECFQNNTTEDSGVYKIHESGILIRILSARMTSKN